MKITFIRHYDKQQGWQRSSLLTVIPADSRDMSQEFVASQRDQIRNRILDDRRSKRFESDFYD
jgi:hypothetical protein